MNAKDNIMKKEDIQEKTMEAQRVFVENLPKPKGWLRENISIIIAAFAFIVSVYSIWLSQKDFIATHRPYVYVSNRRGKKGNMDLKSVMIHCLNAPAKVINREFYYVVAKTEENGEEEITKTIPWELPFTSFLLYPTEETSRQIFYPYEFTKEILAKDPEVKLRRKVRIDYKELSSDRTYYFEGIWDYNRQYDIWETKNMSGD